MNVDEAMALAKELKAELDVEQEPGMYLSEIAAIVLAAEAERLRELLQTMYMHRDHFKSENQHLEAELAAAKAASVVPVKVNSVWADHGSGRVTAYCKNLDDAMEFESWLRDRMKERGEG